MIHVYYKLHPKYSKTETYVWKLARKIEFDNESKPANKRISITRKLLDGLLSGMMKYEDGVLKKFCKSCCDYIPMEDFYKNKTSRNGLLHMCKHCVARKNRINRFAMLHSIVGGSETNPSKFFKTDIGDDVYDALIGGLELNQIARHNGLLDSELDEGESDEKEDSSEEML